MPFDFWSARLVRAGHERIDLHLLTVSLKRADVVQTVGSVGAAGLLVCFVSCRLHFHIASGEKNKYNGRGCCRSLFFIAMLMRGVFAALLRYREFASQFHLRPLAIPRLGSTDRSHTAH